MARVSIREYARRRGVSHTAVMKAIKSKRLEKAVFPDGIDTEIADSEWSKQPQEILKDQPTLRPSAKPPPPVQDEPITAGPAFDKVSSTYAQSRAARETYAARIAKLEFEERSGKLIEAEAVKNESFKLARIVRDAMLNIPDRVAAEFAGETNQFKIHARLSEEIRKAIASLKDEP